MASTSSDRVLVVVGAGPGLGMSVAHRFGREGYAVALISRSTTRHDDYLRSLADAGVEAAAFVGDVNDRHSLRHAIAATRERFGGIDAGYYGPFAVEGFTGGDITALDGAGAEHVLAAVPPAVEFASLLIPELIEKGSGTLLFAGGLSAVLPMPELGGFVLPSAALRNYALTLNAALADKGVYAGVITIGGLIERGDLHTLLTSCAGTAPGQAPPVLNPDALADTLWQLQQDRVAAEAVVPPISG